MFKKTLEISLDCKGNLKINYRSRTQTVITSRRRRKYLIYISTKFFPSRIIHSDAQLHYPIFRLFNKTASTRTWPLLTFLSLSLSNFEKITTREKYATALETFLRLSQFCITRLLSTYIHISARNLAGTMQNFRAAGISAPPIQRFRLSHNHAGFSLSLSLSISLSLSLVRQMPGDFIAAARACKAIAANDLARARTNC